MINTICEQCGKEFEVRPYRVDTARFCSNPCHGLWKSENQCGENNPRWKGGKIKKICIQCEKEFGVWPSSKDQQFCSQKCKGLWQSENIRGKNSPSWKEKVEKVCGICEKEFMVWPCEADMVKFCSNGCRALWQSENMRGENSPNWKGGASFEPYGTEWTDELKEEIRKRDDHICAICGNFGRCVHHINYDKADNRYENLITLDRACHSKTNANREHWEALLIPIAISRMGYDNDHDNRHRQPKRRGG